MSKIFKRKTNYLYPPEKEFKSILKNILGFLPRNLKLYQLAFVHKSVSQIKFKNLNINNERLEYLGDAVLELIITDYLYNSFVDNDEGFLSHLRSKIVNRYYLNNIAIKLGIPNVLLSRINNDHKKFMYGDALEALIGALYLDLGFERTKKIVIERIINNHINIEKLKDIETDFKSKILEWGQKNKKNVTFACFEEQSENKNIFIAQLFVTDEMYGRGKGLSKKEAEQNAAKQALIRLGEI